jgi:hypothetical protein
MEFVFRWESADSTIDRTSRRGVCLRGPSVALAIKRQMRLVSMPVCAASAAKSGEKCGLEVAT